MAAQPPGLSADQLARVTGAAKAALLARTELHDALREARAAGVPLRTLSGAAGLSPEWIRRLTATARRLEYHAGTWGVGKGLPGRARVVGKSVP